MGFAIVQYDDRDVEMFKPLILKNKEYCKTHNINYIFFRSGWEKYPPWWRKVFLVRELLKNYEAVMWVDSDAAIVSCDHFKNLFGSKNKHFVLSPNPPMLELHSLSMFSAPFCAGIWAVRNTPEGITLMDRWVSGYDEKNWKKNGQEWKHTIGVYGGGAYEQGYFELGVWRCKEYESLLENKPYHVLNYLPRSDNNLIGNKCPKNVFAIHYWKGNRNHIKDHWKLSKEEEEEII
jgi:hypothetical protein